jgi:acyl-CoA reductase-like NAD-dependent aldehyde dehydrogenase
MKFHSFRHSYNEKVMANESNFGLGASAWRRDAQEQQRLIDELQTGSL